MKQETGPSATRNMGANFYTILILGLLATLFVNFNLSKALPYFIAAIFAFGIREISWAIRVSAREGN